MNTDTVELLKECNAGIKMGVATINDVLSHIESRKLSEILINSKEEHEKLENETFLILNDYGENGKEPSGIAQTMSKLKTNLKIAFDDSDKSICELIDEGCGMGIKNIRKYMDKYGSADHSAKSIADKLIKLEENLSREVREYY